MKHFSGSCFFHVFSRVFSCCPFGLVLTSGMFSTPRPRFTFLVPQLSRDESSYLPAAELISPTSFTPTPLAIEKKERKTLPIDLSVKETKVPPKAGFFVPVRQIT